MLWSASASARTFSALVVRLAIVRLLLGAGAKVDAASERGWTPLINAAIEGHLEVVRALVEADLRTRSLARGHQVERRQVHLQLQLPGAGERADASCSHFVKWTSESAHLVLALLREWRAALGAPTLNQVVAALLLNDTSTGGAPAGAPIAAPAAADASIVRRFMSVPTSTSERRGKNLK